MSQKDKLFGSYNRSEGLELGHFRHKVRRLQGWKVVELGGHGWVRAQTFQSPLKSIQGYTSFRIREPKGKYEVWDML